MPVRVCHGLLLHEPAPDQSGQTGCGFFRASSLAYVMYSKPSEAFGGGDANLARRTGPHASGCGLLRQPSFDLANSESEFVNRSVFDRLVTKGDTTLPLGECGLQGFELGL